MTKVQPPNPAALPRQQAQPAERCSAAESTTAAEVTPGTTAAPTAEVGSESVDAEVFGKDLAGPAAQAAHAGLQQSLRCLRQLLWHLHKGL